MANGTRPLGDALLGRVWACQLGPLLCAMDSSLMEPRAPPEVEVTAPQVAPFCSMRSG